MVTAVLTGTEDGGIDISAYQVSEQACAMVDADMIEASVDPGIVRVKEEDRSQDNARYVPDVFFRYSFILRDVRDIGAAQEAIKVLYTSVGRTSS